MSPRTGQPTDGEMMNLRGVANYLHCHYFTIYSLLAKGAFPAFRMAAIGGSGVLTWTNGSMIGPSS